MPKVAYDVNQGTVQCSASVICLHLSGITEHINDNFNVYEEFCFEIVHSSSIGVNVKLSQRYQR